MKKMILFMLGAVLTTGAFAQTKKVETKKLENTIADKKADKHEAGNNLKHFRVKRAVNGRKEVRSHRRSIHRQGRNLTRRHGVRHPIHKAKVEVKEEKDAKKGKN